MRFGLSLTLIALLVFGCARPIYETTDPTLTVAGKPAGSDCEVKFKNSNYCLLWRWEKTPTLEEQGSLIFKVVRPNLLDDSLVPVDLASIPTLEMSLSGKSETNKASTSQVDTGSFRTENVQFGKAGIWTMKFQLKDKEQVIDEATVTYNFYHCDNHFKDSKNCLVWQWETPPSDVARGSLAFKITRFNKLDGSLIPIESAHKTELQLWMPSMGHGSSRTKTTTVDKGSYRVTDVFFVMPGQWEMKFQVKEGDRVTDEAVVPITL